MGNEFKLGFEALAEPIAYCPVPIAIKNVRFLYGKRYRTDTGFYS